jgi:hypothetical protein
LRWDRYEFSSGISRREDYANPDLLPAVCENFYLRYTFIPCARWVLDKECLEIGPRRRSWGMPGEENPTGLYGTVEMILDRF